LCSTVFGLMKSAAAMSRLVARGRQFGRPSFGVLDRFVSAGWVKRSSRGRAVTVTDRGRTALADCFGIDWTD
jgi:hypothetical protein